MDAATPQTLAPGGRLRDQTVGSTERNSAIALHLAPLAGVVFAPLYLLPLVVWLLRRDDSAFEDDHGREVINFCISVVLWHVVTAITVIGFVLWPVLWIVALVSLIRGAVAAGNGEYFRYPMTVRML